MRRRPLWVGASVVFVAAVLLPALGHATEVVAAASEGVGAAGATVPDGPPPRGFVFWLLFWAPAAVLLVLLARVLFREQWGELRTLRLLTNGIGPYFSEFDLPDLHRWVERCAPHVWHGWRKRSFDGLADFATPECLAAAEARFAAEAREGRVFEGRFEKLLKVHPLDVRMDGPGPAPRDVTLLLRIEALATDVSRGRETPIPAEASKPAQLQQFWTLCNDGRKWRLAQVAPARGDLPPLPPAPPLPGLLDWKRPPDMTEEREGTT